MHIDNDSVSAALEILSRPSFSSSYKIFLHEKKLVETFFLSSLFAYFFLDATSHSSDHNSLHLHSSIQAA
jgi:hypothetical protein